MSVSGSAIPAELRALPRWVRWKSVPDEPKPRKIPIRPVSPAPASSTNPATWGTFEDALANVGKHGTCGLGFVFAKEDDFFGVDIDGCLTEEGRPTEAAAAEIARFSSYTEESPSGLGVHIIGRGSLNGHRGMNRKGVEVYGEGRYFTMTGKVLPGAPKTLAACQPALDELVARLDPPRPAPYPISRPARRTDDPGRIAERARAYIAKMPAAIAGQRGHDKTFAVALALVKGFSLDAGTALDLMHEYNSRCEPPWNEKDLLHKIGDAIDADVTDGYIVDRDEPGRHVAGSRSIGGPAPDKPRIVVTEGDLPAVVTAAEDALVIDGEEPIFQQGGQLVRVARTSGVTIGDGVSRPPGALVIVPVEKVYLTERLTRAATWLKPAGRKRELRQIDAPPRVAEHLLARVGEWRLPVLTGIIETPTLRPDGSILDAPGYDAATGILYEPGAAVFPRISEHATRAEAEKGAALLLDVLKGFPFVSEVSRAAALSMFLTALVRRSLPSAPLFGVGATTMGSGKSLLGDCASLIQTGRRAAAMTQAGDDAEDQKRWLAALMAGDPLVMLDNVSRPLGSDALNSILTQETYRARVLGGSKQATVSTAVLIVATGNNLELEGDLRTRVIPIDLDARMERPEERQFDVNLLEWIPQHRGELVKAGLDILRAYHVAERPGAPEPVFGRFEVWSAWIRGAVMWLGYLDPCLGRRRLEGRDPVARNLHALLTNWTAAVGPRRVTTAEIIRAAEATDNSGLKEALVELAGDQRGGVNAKSLGRSLRGFEGRIGSGLRITRAGERHGSVLWSVETDSPEGLEVKEALPISPHVKSFGDFIYIPGSANPLKAPNPPSGGAS